MPYASDPEIDDFARRFFTNKEIKKQGITLLASVGPDESAIDVEADRSSIAYLTAIDRRLMELALRRNKMFRQIEDRRGIAVPPGHRHVDQEV